MSFSKSRRIAALSVFRRDIISQTELPIPKILKILKMVPRMVPQEILSASIGIKLSSNQATTFRKAEASNMPLIVTTTRNLFDQTTVPHQHQPYFGLANCQDHTKKQQYVTTPISLETTPTLKLDTSNGNPLICIDWI